MESIDYIESQDARNGRSSRFSYYST